MNLFDDDFDAPPAPQQEGSTDPVTGEVLGQPVPGTGSPLDVRENIRKAFEVAGGWKYLVTLAHSAIPSDRSAFMSLLAKTVPTEVKTDVAMAITVSTINYSAAKAAQAVIQHAARQDVTDVESRQHPLLD
jgi:hypothetical protein